MASLYDFDYQLHRDKLMDILREVHALRVLTWPHFRKILHRYPAPGGVFSKHQIVQALDGFREEIKQGKLSARSFGWLNDENLRPKIQMKPTRTQSGVTPVTVLTQPHPCPGQCIFCPNDTRMPKSYLSDEPGAQRAERNRFDPYLQTFSRLKALAAIGHVVDKVELIVLGGTWSFYPESYQIWFIMRMFEAVNDFAEKNFAQFETLLPQIGIESHRSLPKNSDIIRNVKAAKPMTGQASQTYNQIVTHKMKQQKQQFPEYYDTHTTTWSQLYTQHRRNETSACKVSGLVIETRPDAISPQEVLRIRKLGCTKTQIGFQSLQNSVLQKNHRGHDVAATRYAIYLLRLAGFKIHGHWMANLYGSTPMADIQEYTTMFADPDFRPDELKVYPCSLIETAELMDYHQAGLWRPYSHTDLLDVVTAVMADTPQYCRLTRIIRDIPSTDIVAGNTFTNFRQMAEEEIKKRGITVQEIRSREIKNATVSPQDIRMEIVCYSSSFGREYFLQCITSNHSIIGFLRLALPGNNHINTPPQSFKKQDEIDSAYRSCTHSLLPTPLLPTSIDSIPIKYSDQQVCAVDPDFIHPFCDELNQAAIIREIHVYGKVVQVGDTQPGKAQHFGIGKKLITTAEAISRSENFTRIAVISSIGTRQYYRKRGFTDGDLYQVKVL